MTNRLLTLPPFSAPPPRPHSANVLEHWRRSPPLTTGARSNNEEEEGSVGGGQRHCRAPRPACLLGLTGRWRWMAGVLLTLPPFSAPPPRPHSANVLEHWRRSPPLTTGARSNNEEEEGSVGGGQRHCRAPRPACLLGLTGRWRWMAGVFDVANIEPGDC